MRRNFSFILPGAILAAGTLCAAPNPSISSAQYLNQINEQTYQIQAQADGLERYVRSGARDAVNSAAYTVDMAEDEQKLSAVLDQIAARPGATNDTRMQVEKLKTVTIELMSFTGSALHDLESRALALHEQDVFANISNIEERCSAIRSAAETLLAVR
jgi:hypothetical protein